MHAGLTMVGAFTAFLGIAAAAQAATHARGPIHAPRQCFFVADKAVAKPILPDGSLNTAGNSYVACQIREDDWVWFRTDEVNTVIAPGANSGDAIDMRLMGLLALNGLGVQGGDAQALAWFERAGAAGDVRGMLYAAQMLADGRGRKRDAAAAAAWWRKAADRHSPLAQLNLGRMYEKGLGVPMNAGEADRHYALAAPLGCVPGVIISVEGGDGSPTIPLPTPLPPEPKRSWECRVYAGSPSGGLKVDEAEGLRLFLASVAQGNRDSLYNYGLFLSSGSRDIPKDPRKAFQMFKRAADAGDTQSMAIVGRAYLAGDGIGRNDALGFGWLKKAADANEVSGMDPLGDAYATGRGAAADPAQALRWYKASTALSLEGGFILYGAGDLQARALMQRAAEAGDRDAMLYWGEYLIQGLDAFRIRDTPPPANEVAQGVAWIRKAAEAGNPVAARRLGSLLETGRHISANLDEAVDWYIRAARSGDAQAMAALAAVYGCDDCALRSPSLALDWERQAATAGDPTSMSALGHRYHTGDGVPKDLTQAVFWLRKAADHDDDAMAELGEMLISGEGVPRDETEAARLWRKAANWGNEDAIRLLYEHGLGPDPDEDP